MQVFLSFFSAFPANRKERKMSVSALALSQLGERNIISSVKNTWSNSALDKCIKNVLGAHARGLFGDGFVDPSTMRSTSVERCSLRQKNRRRVARQNGARH